MDSYQVKLVLTFMATASSALASFSFSFLGATTRATLREQQNGIE